jgi:recombination protein RecT
MTPRMFFSVRGAERASITTQIVFNLRKNLGMKIFYLRRNRMTNQNNQIQTAPQEPPNMEILKAEPKTLKKLMRSDEIFQRFSEVVGNQQAGGYISSVLTAVGLSESLQKCEPVSIISCGIRAATMRLSVDPAVSHAYLVPFWDKNIKGYRCSLIVGYKGLQHMAIRSGHYERLNLTYIYADDELVWNRMTGATWLKVGEVNAVAERNKRLSEDPVAYLLYIKLLNGFQSTFFMTTQECDKHGQKFSKNYYNKDGSINNASLWHTDPQAMFRKTVVRLGILKNGYLDPQDLNLMNQHDSDYAEAETDMLNGIKISEIKSPSVQDSMSELGLGRESQAPEDGPQFSDDGQDLFAQAQQSQEPEPQAPAPLFTYEEAFNSTDHTGAKYGNMTNKELKGHVIGLEQKLRGELSGIEQGQCQDKLEKIRILLAVPEADRLKSTGQPSLDLEIENK